MSDTAYKEPDGFKGTPGEMVAKIEGRIAYIRTKNIPFTYIGEVRLYDNVIDKETGSANAALLVNSKECLKALLGIVGFNDRNNLCDEYANNGPNYAPDT